MAIFEITEGAPGNGKSLYSAEKAQFLCIRNHKWFLKTGIRRKVASNIKFSPCFEQKWGDYIVYWSDAQELLKMRDCDIIWDEIATEIDSRNWANLSIEMKRFLSQYRKRGVDIYANTQDFSMIDLRARLMITKVRTMNKVIGSRDISATKPNPKYIWGLIIIREVLNYKETDPEKKKYNLIPEVLFITKEGISIYDTTQDIELSPPAPLKHIVRRCEFYGIDGHDCKNHEKVFHQ